MPVPVYAGANISIGNGVTVLFPYNFKILDQTHVEVKVDGVLKVLGADYTVSGVGNSAGGNVTFLVAPANLTVVQRARKVPYKRDTDYQANGDFKEDTVDADFDLEEMQVQQIAADVMRAFKAPLSVTADQTLSDAAWAARALQFLGFDGAGNVGLFQSPTAGALVVSAYIQTLLDDLTAAAARTTLGIDGVNKNIAAGDLADRSVLARTIADATLGFNIVNGTVVQTRVGNAETFAVKTLAGNDPSAADPVGFVFRDQVATTGGYIVRWVTAALSLTISSGSTTGAVNGVPFRLWLVAFDDAGTVRLGAINCLSSVAGAGSGRDVTAIYPLAQFGVASSTAEGGAGAADNAQTFYTGVAVAAKPYTPVSYSTWEAGLAAAGTWVTAPSRIQLFGRGVPLPGQPIQFARIDTGAVATGATTVPNDDTIPASTEGDLYMAAPAITPSSAANVLRLCAKGHFTNSVINQFAMSFYQDAVVNALKTAHQLITNAGSEIQMAAEHEMLAAAAVATTFKVRAGGASAGTTTFNGSAGARLYGGVLSSLLRVEEIMA